MMRLQTFVGILIVLVIVAAGVLLLVHNYMKPAMGVATSTPQSVGTTTPPQPQTIVTPAGLSFSYLEPYGLATTPEQILVKSYIPACDQGFDYCLYRTGDQYASTNFESAGLAITQRKDLTTQTKCLTSEPAGYTGIHATTSVQSTYATSVLSPISDGAAGHYASGQEYRLWFGSSTCYSFTTRIGETQFANYPAGTKVEFSAADRARVMQELTTLLSAMTVGGQAIVFPQS